MKSSYRKSLENAARQTTLVQSADTLIKLILRIIVSNSKVKHAGIFLYDKERDEYVLKVSHGNSDFKIPSGFVKISRNNVLIRYFLDKKGEFSSDIILLREIDKLFELPKVKNDLAFREFIVELKNNLSLYQAQICIPGFFRKDLIFVLFLGNKVNLEGFGEEEIGFLTVLVSNIVMAIKNAWLVEDLNKQLQINKRLFLQTVSALTSSIEAKDKYTVGHTERVMKHCLVIVEHLKEDKRIFNEEKFKEDLRVSALLHDIGKIGISEKILNKKGPLTQRERKIIEKHPLTGVGILNHIEEFSEVLLGVKHHHERPDGQGYPCRLKGKQIPLIAAIIAIADTFDAMTVGRSYRDAVAPMDAVREIKKNKGKQFLPAVVNAFLKAYKY
ncbi:MAG: HD domain-containing phosphohydrolase [Candidatus Omnitrophota bacterium]|nr:HD domain-containing protein [Candidatus Omnitrophota bacterium]